MIRATPTTLDISVEGALNTCMRISSPSTRWPLEYHIALVCMVATIPRLAFNVNTDSSSESIVYTERYAEARVADAVGAEPFVGKGIVDARWVRASAILLAGSWTQSHGVVNSNIEWRGFDSKVQSKQKT